MAGKTTEKDHTKINDEIIVDASGGRPKSKKELRLERKAAKTKMAEQKTTPSPEANGEKVLDKEEYLRVKKMKKAELRKEQEKLARKELREEGKNRKRRKLNRELNAKGGAKKKEKLAAAQEQHAATGEASSKDNDGAQNKTPSSKKKKGNSNKKSKDEQDASMDAFRSILYGTSDANATVGGMITTRLGVQYEDKIVGKGKTMREGKPITVRYELTGGKFGAVLDSSNKFTFRPGMGEVIQGWDIGLEGMREGGRRKLIVPPKAGYAGKDIGAGPGALLYFDVTLVSCSR